MEFLFFVFSIFAIASVAMVIALTLVVWNLLKQISELEDELEANLPPF
jgi:nitrate reductase NapE component